jgi:hypothetical protein
MAVKDKSRRDGSRRRCLLCGHPKAEHRGDLPCTVPKCLCEQYQPALSVEKATKPA